MRPRSMEALSHSRPMQPQQQRRQFRDDVDNLSSDELSSEGSDEIWRPSESNETIRSANRQNGKLSTPSGAQSAQQSPVSA